VVKRIKKSDQSLTPPRKKQIYESHQEGDSRSHNDFENLLDSAKLAALFLDRELHIRRYTPNAQKLLNLMAVDQGRSITRLKRRLGYDQIVEDANRVLQFSIPVERQVRAKNGRWFMLRINPYDTQDSQNYGVMVIFIDITATKRAGQSAQELDETLEARVVKRTEQRDEANRKLRQTRNTFYTLFHTNPIPIALTRVEDDSFINVNIGFLKYFDLKLEDVIGHTAQELKLGMKLQSEERSRLVAQLQKEGDIQNYEREMVLPSGKTVTLLASLQYILIDNTEAILSAFIDITERKQAEEILRNMVDAAPDATVVINEDGNIVIVNRQLESVFGYARRDLIGKTIRTLIPERFHEIHPQHRMQYFREPKYRPMGTGLKLYGRRCDGTEFPVEISLSPLKTPDGMLAIAAIRDITKRVEAERKMRQLATLLSGAEQRERQRISQLLHDDLQQRLYAVKTELSTVDQSIKQQDWKTAQTAFADLDQRLAEAISITRNLSIDLNPIIPEGEALADALAMLAAQMQKQYSLNVALKMDGVKTNFDDNLNVLLYQATRELLFNVVKHAEILEAAVTLEQVDDQIRITVSDEGKGFDPAAVMNDPGSAHGLLNIRQHLESMGCRMEISSGPDTGTRVVIHCPTQVSSLSLSI
jgi:PAS domain S-box-containing protein